MKSVTREVVGIRESNGTVGVVASTLRGYVRRNGEMWNFYAIRAICVIRGESLRFFKSGTTGSRLQDASNHAAARSRQLLHARLAGAMDGLAGTVNL